LALYQRLHGRTDNAFERARSPFHPEQTAVWVVNDIPTYFRQRDKSLFKLSQLVEHFMAAGPGRYLIGFSSYAYLDAFSQQHRPKSHSYFFQRSGESEEAIDQHRRRLEQERSTVFGVVMGGSFSESIEFLDAPLSGIIVVGLGLPPPSLQRDLTASYFDRNEGLGWGQMVAYHQPALAKVVQMAGRLLRSERDRGVICLVDERFQQPQIQSFLPAHWQTQTIGLNRLKKALQTFLEHDIAGAGK
jgi:Rad3-related DNA helicase